MSKKIRNTYRRGVMRNFSNNVIERYILIDDEVMPETDKDIFVKEINEQLWYAIQETNAISNGRILPFVIVKRVIREQAKLRIVINELDSNSTLSDYNDPPSLILDPKEMSHLINFKAATPQRRISVSDELVPGNAKMIIDRKDQIAAAVDIFLDIATFNSYSFLKNSSHSEKQSINADKYSFYNDNLLRSYYKVDKNNPPGYYSFAFTARNSKEDISYRDYVQLWSKFISNSKYSGNVHSEIKPEEQLKWHRDKENLKKEYFTRDFWDSYEEGDYLLLRINRDVNTDKQKEEISTYFGINPFHIGETKIVPISEYFNPMVKRYMQELVISAFKIVV